MIMYGERTALDRDAAAAAAVAVTLALRDAVDGRLRADVAASPPRPRPALPA